MDKPILDCNLNNPPPNVTGFRFSLHFSEVGPDYIMWFVSSAHNKHGGGNSGKKTNPTFVTYSWASVQTTSFLVFLKNNKHATTGYHPSYRVLFHQVYEDIPPTARKR